MFHKFKKKMSEKERVLYDIETCKINRGVYVKWETEANHRLALLNSDMREAFDEDLDKIAKEIESVEKILKLVRKKIDETNRDSDLLLSRFEMMDMTETVNSFDVNKKAASLS